MAKEKVSKLEGRRIYLLREIDANEGDYWVTYETEEEAIEAADDSQMIFAATIENCGTVRKVVE